MTEVDRRAERTVEAFLDRGLVPDRAVEDVNSHLREGEQMRALETVLELRGKHRRLRA